MCVPQFTKGCAKNRSIAAETKLKMILKALPLGYLLDSAMHVRNDFNALVLSIETIDHR